MDRDALVERHLSINFIPIVTAVQTRLLQGLLLLLRKMVRSYDGVHDMFVQSPDTQLQKIPRPEGKTTKFTDSERELRRRYIFVLRFGKDSPVTVQFHD